LEPGPRFNVFSGDNGQGKTNFIEAVYALCTLRSFRSSRLADIIAIGAEGAHLQAVLERDGLERSYELGLKPRGRTVRLDGKSVRPISRYFGDFNVVLFAPEDLQVPRGSPGVRRKFLDRAVFNRERGYMATVSAYEKALKSRNVLLRDAQGGRPPDPSVMAAFDEQVALFGARILLARRRYIDELSPRFVAAFESIAHTSLVAGITYQQTANLALDTGESALVAAFREALAETVRRDTARGSTSVGPHRDDLGFFLDGQAAATFASQGQLRALVLGWKTAEMSLLEATHENAPILLLDDVSSELDDTRNRTLFDFLRQRKNQCFITTTAARHVLLDADRIDFTVEAGRIARSSSTD